jgi:hypothetical protein
MLSYLIQKIMEFFETARKSDLEKFIESRHPTDAADLERLLFEYMARNKGGIC